jgi:hypothetical protein
MKRASRTGRKLSVDTTVANPDAVGGDGKRQRTQRVQIQEQLSRKEITYNKTTSRTGRKAPAPRSMARIKNKPKVPKEVSHEVNQHIDELHNTLELENENEAIKSTIISLAGLYMTEQPTGVDEAIQSLETKIKETEAQLLKKHTKWNRTVQLKDKYRRNLKRVV